MSTDDPRARILKAAGPIFAEKGFEGATVREICQAAGVNLAAVNYHFGSKESLYKAALRHVHPGKSGPTADLSWPNGTPVERKLYDFIHNLLVHLLDVKPSPWQERLFVREIMDPSPAFQEVLQERFRAGLERLQTILDEVLPADTAPYERHQTALSIVGQCVYYRAHWKILPLIVGQAELDAHYGSRQLAQHIARFSLAALGLEPPLGDLAGHARTGGQGAGTS